MITRRDLAISPVPPRHPAERADVRLASAVVAVARVAPRSPLMAIVTVMVGLDLLFALVETLVQATDYGFPGAHHLSLQTEGGLPEIYGYAKSGVVAGLLFTAWRRWRHGPPAPWGASACTCT